MQQPDRITVEEVARRIGAGEKLVFVDAREPNNWAESEELIGGATRVPPDEVTHHTGRLPKNPIVVYCDSPGEAASTRVATELAARGWHEARPLMGGLEAWKRARLPLVSKSKGREEPRPVHGTAHPYPPSPSGEASPPERMQSPVHVSSPREGVAGTGRPSTPMADPPSAHRKQPDDVGGLPQTRSKGGDLDVRQRIQVGDIGTRPRDTTESVPGDRESLRFSQRPSQRH